MLSMPGSGNLFNQVGYDALDYAVRIARRPSGPFLIRRLHTKTVQKTQMGKIGRARGLC